MVAGGSGPLLFVWDLAAAELLYALHLPTACSVYGTSQLRFMPDSQTVAGMVSTYSRALVTSTSGHVSSFTCLFVCINQPADIVHLHHTVQPATLKC